MFFQRIVLGCLLVCSTLGRSIFRSGKSGHISLVEFDIRGVTYGKCSYINEFGEKVAVLFEEHSDGVHARSEIPTVIDPVSEVARCKDAAVAKPQERSFRSSDIEDSESDSELDLRLREFERKISSDQDYVSSLRPRFLKFVPASSDASSASPTANSPGLFSRLFGNLSALSLGTVDVPFVVLNVPLAIRNFTVPVLMPSLQRVSVPYPVIGGR